MGALGARMAALGAAPAWIPGPGWKPLRSLGVPESQSHKRFDPLPLSVLTHALTALLPQLKLGRQRSARVSQSPLLCFD